MHCRGMMPPLGLLTIASYLPEDFEVRLIDRNVAEETDADWKWADVIFLSAMLAQRRDYETCIERARGAASRSRSAVPSPTRFRKSCWRTPTGSASVRRSPSWTSSSGISGPAGGASATGREQDQHGRRPDPALRAGSRPRRLHGHGGAVSRGCPFQCEFCDIIEIYGRVPRTKTPAQVIGRPGSTAQTRIRGLRLHGRRQLHREQEEGQGDAEGARGLESRRTATPSRSSRKPRSTWRTTRSCSKRCQRRASCGSSSASKRRIPSCSRPRSRRRTFPEIRWQS